MITVDTIKTTEDFRGLREEWDELLRSSSVNCFFLTWDWLFTWWLQLSEDRKLHIISVRCDHRLIGIAPLALRPRRLMRLLPFRVLEFLGTGSVGSDYLNILIRDGWEDEALRNIAACLTEKNLMMELAQMDRTSSNAIDLALQLKQLGWNPARITTNFCPYIRLAGHTWESYLASLGRSHRYNFRRRLKKLNKNFNVRFEQACSEEQRHEALSALVTLHLKRWRSRGGSDALHRPRLLEFHEELTRIALQHDWLRLYVLWLDGEPAAALYGINYNNTFYFYQSGFDPAFSKYSVGLVTMGLAIKNAIREGVDEYDFLHGHEDYKFLWARDERELVRLDLFPPYIRGSIYRQSMHVRWLTKRLIWKWLPQPLGEWLAPGRRLELYWNSLRSRSRYVTRTD